MSVKNQNLVNLGKAATIKGGKRVPKGVELSKTRTSHPYIRARDIKNGRISFSDPVYLDDETASTLSRYTVKTGDICLTIVGASFGDIGEVPSWLDEANLTENAVKITAKQGFNQKFIKYSLLSQKSLEQMKALVGGSAQPKLGIYKVESLEFHCPDDIALQTRIGQILSAHDELIDNNSKRIEKLETMARLLYRHYFEVPESSDWEEKPIAELLSSHIGGGWGSDKRSESFTDSAYVIRGTDIPPARNGNASGVPHRFHKPSNLRSRKLIAGDIIFEVSGGSKGQPLGRSLLVTEKLLSAFDDDVMCASFCKRVTPNQDVIAPEILYLSFLDAYENGEIETYSVQSTGISNFKWSEYVERVTRPVPPIELQQDFQGKVAPMLRQINVLGIRNANLRKTRDLLLPKLMSGEIEV